MMSFHLLFIRYMYQNIHYLSIEKMDISSNCLDIVFNWKIGITEKESRKEFFVVNPSAILN